MDVSNSEIPSATYSTFRERCPDPMLFEIHRYPYARRAYQCGLICTPPGVSVENLAHLRHRLVVGGPLSMISPDTRNCAVHVHPPVRSLTEVSHWTVICEAFLIVTGSPAPQSQCQTEKGKHADRAGYRSEFPLGWVPRSAWGDWFQHHAIGAVTVEKHHHKIGASGQARRKPKFGCARHPIDLPDR